MKVVINACYGGFSLSPAALKRLILEKSPGITETLAKDRRRSKGPMVAIGDGFYHEEYLPSVLFKDDKVYQYNDSDRTDPTLIRVVEELGEEANGPYAELKVVEIPDDVQWHIQVYDGAEWIAENHRTWS